MSRPLVLVGGYLTAPRDFAGLAAALEQPPYSYRVFIAPIGRVRWALTRDYDFRPAARLIQATVDRARAACNAERVTMLAYSVGGTAARLYLGDQPYLGDLYAGCRYVDQLITLGTPQRSLERWTLKLYDYVNLTYPGAYHGNVRYVAVVGRSLRGSPRGNLRQRMARNSYVMVSGPQHAEDWGDGVTSLVSAVLPGAEFLAVNGLYHSPFHGQPWYGDSRGLPHWERVLAG